MYEFKIVLIVSVSINCVLILIHILFYCPLIRMPFVFLFFTIAEFMIVCVNMCEGIRVEVRARIHNEVLKVPTGECQVGCL